MPDQNNLFIPTHYEKGYVKARLKDPDLAERYIRNTTIGDPDLDPVVEECSEALSADKFAKFIKAGINQNPDVLANAPACLREFFHKVDHENPPWLNYDLFKPASRAVYKNANLVLGGFVTGALVEGFSTMIAKSFAMTGRVGSKNTRRRLGYNLRHILEIFYPDGMLRKNDGWRMSMRIRFMHSRVRYLLKNHDEWDHAAWGYPLSAAHIGFANTVFSMRVLHHGTLLGLKFSREETNSYMDVFRYVGYLFGTPDDVLYKDLKHAKEIYKIGLLCEPNPPDQDSITVANALIQAVPVVIRTPKDQVKKQLRLGYSLSRILIGRKMSNKLGLEKHAGLFRLLKFRFDIFLQRYLTSTQFKRKRNFMDLLGSSSYEADEGISFKLPTHVKDEMSKEW